MGKVKLFPSPEHTSKAAEGPSGPQTADDWHTAWAQQIWQNGGSDQHDSGAVQGLLRKNLPVQPQHQPRRRWRPVKKYIEETMKVPVDREQTSRHCAKQADEAAIPLPDFDRYRRLRRQSAPAQALGRQRAGHTVCVWETLPDQHSREHPKNCASSATPRASTANSSAFGA